MVREKSTVEIMKSQLTVTLKGSLTSVLNFIFIDTLDSTGEAAAETSEPLNVRLLQSCLK